MAYSPELEKRIDAVARKLDMHFKKKHLFGGLAYFAKGGNRAFAVRVRQTWMKLTGVNMEKMRRYRLY